MSESNPVEVTRFALKYAPRTLVVEYRKEGKSFVTKITIKHTMEPSVLLKKLVKKYGHLLGPDKCDHTQLLELLAMLLNGDEVEMSKPHKYDNTSSYRPCQTIDLNKVSEIENKKAKAEMNKDFEANRIKPGDPDYVYDKEVEFNGAKVKSDWDDDDDDDD